MSRSAWNPETGVTIDAFSARDLDDGIWVARTGNGWRLTGSVADVDRLVPQGSRADRIAMSRGLTQYAPGIEPQPMIDRELVSEHLSLLPGLDRPALTLKLHFGWDGTPGAGSAERGSFRSIAKLSYRDFEELSHPHVEPRARRFVADATSLASALFKARVARAGMPEWESGFDSEGRIVAGVRPGVLAQTVLHELMVSLNAAATRLVTSIGMPMIYRNQGSSASGRGGRYEGVNRGHAALGIDAYGQFMSGIRRYVDLVNQRVLIAAIRGECAPYTRTEIAEISAASNRIAQRSSAIQRQHAVRQGIPLRNERPLIERMDADAFSTALRETPDDETLSEASRRLEEGMLLPRDIWFLLDTGSPLRPDEIPNLARRTAATPGASEAVLSCSGIAIDSETREAGGSWSCALLRTGMSTIGTGGSHAEARDAAMRSLLQQQMGILPSDDVSGARPIKLGMQTSFAELQALASAARWPDPVIRTEPRGRSGTPLFRTSAQVDVGPFVYRSPSVVASTERAAVETVSALALDCLRSVAAEQIARDGALHGPDYADMLAHREGALGDFCVRNGISRSVEWNTERCGTPLFACQVVLRQGSHELVGEGADHSREGAIALAEAALRSILTPRQLAVPEPGQEHVAPVSPEPVPAMG